MTGVARKRIPVAIAVPVQLNLGLLWRDPIRHRHHRATTHPAPAMAQAVALRRVA